MADLFLYCHRPVICNTLDPNPTLRLRSMWEYLDPSLIEKGVSVCDSYNC